MAAVLTLLLMLALIIIAGVFAYGLVRDVMRGEKFSIIVCLVIVTVVAAQALIHWMGWLLEKVTT
jgi:hypothetical protein